MQNSEHIDLTKGIIGILVFLLVAGLCISLYYYSSDEYSEELTNMKESAEAANLATLYDMQNMSQNGDYILIPTVANALLSIDPQALLYIRVNGTMYSYAAVQNAIQTTDPIGMAVRDLMKFSDNRCSVSIGTAAQDFLYIDIQVR